MLGCVALAIACLILVIVLFALWPTDRGSVYWIQVVGVAAVGAAAAWIAWSVNSSSDRATSVGAPSVCECCRAEAPTIKVSLIGTLGPSS